MKFDRESIKKITVESVTKQNQMTDDEKFEKYAEAKIMFHAQLGVDSIVMDVDSNCVDAFKKYLLDREFTVKTDDIYLPHGTTGNPVFEFAKRITICW